MTSEMMPCPFCGANPKCYEADDGEWWIECNSCRVEQMKLFETMQDAIAAWNTLIAPAAGEVARLAEEWVEQA